MENKNPQDKKEEEDILSRINDESIKETYQNQQSTSKRINEQSTTYSNVTEGNDNKESTSYINSQSRDKYGDPFPKPSKKFVKIKISLKK